MSAAAAIEVEIDYEPRSIQRELHDAIARGCRHALLVWHRRGGKTAGCINQLIRTATTSRKKLPRCIYVAPLLNQAKKIAWDGITGLRHFASVIPGVKFNESELRADFPNGGRVQLFGADNPDAMRGIYADAAVIDEFGQVAPKVRTEIILPALSDRGGYEIIAGTPKGLNHFHELFEAAKASAEWFVSLRRASDTQLVADEILADARREMGDDTYRQEFECAWLAAARGTFYAKLLEEAEAQGRITSVPHDTGLRTFTAWDLGIGDATAIWCAQPLGREVRLIDYYEAEGEALAHYVKTLQEKRYVYAEDLVPHDADHRTLQTGKTLVDMGRALGRNMRVVPQMGLEDGIEAARQLLSRCWFDREKCGPGLAALRAYTRRYNSRLDEFMDTPQHDWASHGADAFRYLAAGLRAPKATGVTPRRPDTRWIV